LLLHQRVTDDSQFTIACWYTRHELHKRISFAYGVGVVASALAGILSYGLGQLDGHRGMRGWRWIFSIEGGFSMAFGLLAFLFVPKFPDRTKWIKPEQRVYLYSKLEKDRGEYKTGEVDMSSFLKTSKDWTLWVQGSIYCFNVGTANAIGFFTPTIISVSTLSRRICLMLTLLQGLGYSGLDASLRSGYPFFAALGLLGLTSYLSDKYQKRASICIFNSVVMIVGFSSRSFSSRALLFPNGCPQLCVRASPTMSGILASSWPQWVCTRTHPPCWHSTNPMSLTPQLAL
jgi:hypothetical protein